MTAETVARRQRQRGESGVSTPESIDSVAPARSFARVDLVPPIVETRRKNAALERKLAAGLILLVALIIAAALGVAILAFAAEGRLDAERTRTQVLLNEQRSYAEVANVKAQLADYDDAEIAAVFSEANWSRLMRELDTVLPGDVALATESISVKGLSADTSGIYEVTGLDAPGVIEISFSATAVRFDSPTPLLDALKGLTGYVSATVDAVAESGEEGYTITGVVQLGADALGGTSRADALDADVLAALHEQLEIAATTTPAAETDAATDTTDATTGTGE